MNNNQVLNTLAIAAVAIGSLGLAAPSFAGTASNTTRWETSTGTRKVTGSSFVKGDRFSVQDESVFKLDATGAGATGDAYYRHGQLGGAVWSKNNDGGKTPAFVAGYESSETTITNEWFGSNTQFESEEHFTAGEDSFTIGD